MKRIFITGGASGLGKALAKKYSALGCRVAIGDVDTINGLKVERDLLSAGGTAKFFSCDVAKEEDLAKVAEWIKSNWGGLDILINNAGVACAGEVEKQELEDWQWLMEVNLLGVVRGCKTFIPMFKKQGHGHIVNIASLAGLVHSPNMAAYNCAKAAVVALSETLLFELKSSGTAVSVVCPSFFRTNLCANSRTTTKEERESLNFLVGRAKNSAESIATEVVDGVARKKFLILTDAEGKLAKFMKRVLPFRLYAGLFYLVIKQKMIKSQS